MFDKRWTYWAKTIENKKPLDEPIPKIQFLSSPNPEASKNLKDCVEFMQRKGYSSESWMNFIEWLLWGFGAKLQTEFPIKVTEEISWYWYKTFNMGILMKYPHDYMSWGSCELANMARSGNSNGYFPTPQHIVKMMNLMIMTDADKTKTVCDPCAGTGIMLLEASNYSLRLYAVDISLNMCKMATVNAFLYIPWLAYPADNLIDWNTKEDYEKTLNSLKDWNNNITKSNIPVMLMLTYNPRTNDLSSWI